jgi:hypothetical protein
MYEIVLVLGELIVHIRDKITRHKRVKTYSVLSTQNLCFLELLSELRKCDDTILMLKTWKQILTNSTSSSMVGVSGKGRKLNVFYGRYMIRIK